MPELVHLDVDDGVGIVRLDRPPANAISLQLSIELLRALQEAGSRDDVGALVLWTSRRWSTWTTMASGSR